jgi:glutamate synthase (NADPH/NADH) small chain
MSEGRDQGIDRRARLALPPVHAGERPVDERLLDFEEVLTLPSLEEARQEATRCLQCPTAPCREACPLHNDIPRALAHLERGDGFGAAEVYRETNPFPEVCGRLCPQQYCQDACVLSRRDKPIDTRRLEAFAATYQRERRGVPLPRRVPFTGSQIAIVGGGPAGLSVAEHLARRGHAVIVFDQHPQPGGMLNHAIPPFKLSREIVAAKLRWLRLLGIRFQPNTRVGHEVMVDELLEVYDAVFLGTGAPQPYAARLPGERLDGIYQALPFLRKAGLPDEILPEEWQSPFEVVEERFPQEIGPRVHVLGGGNTAMDCLRTALRLTGVEEVTCYYRRSAEEMPACEEEYRLAREEGAEFVWQACPVRFAGDGAGKLRAVVYQRMKLGEPDAEGRCRPVPLPGSEFQVEVDTVVLAFGHRPEEEFLSGVLDLELNGKGRVLVDHPQTGRTSVASLFAAGDVVRGADLLAPAVADALSVAATIDAFLAK